MSKKEKIPRPRKPFLERFPFSRFPFTLLRSLLLFGADLIGTARVQVERSIRMQLVLTFGICLLASMLFYGISSSLFGQINEETLIDYSSGRDAIDYDARSLARQLDPNQGEDNNPDDPQGAYDSTENANGIGPWRTSSTKTIPAVPALSGVPAAPAAPIAQGGAPNAPQVNAPQAQSASAALDAMQNAAQPTVPTTPGVPPSGIDPTAASPVRPLQGAIDPLTEQRKRQVEENRKRDFLDTVKRLSIDERYKIVITDLEGRVILRSDNSPETNIDVHSVIRNAMETRNNHTNDRMEFSSFYPVTYNDQKSYLIVSGIPQPTISYRKAESPLSYLSAFVFFIFLFYYLTQKKMRYIEELASGLRLIATGNLDYRVVERMQDELGSLAKDMNFMVSDLQRKIEEERRSERLKNELITNVSHDLRTPLTLIIGYLRLLHDKNYETQEQASGYVNIAYNKSEKLRTLIDDLFEYTKLSNHDVPLHKRGVILNEVLEQLLEEYVTISEQKQLTLIRSIPQERITVNIDVEQMIRVFENLLGNAVKYSPKPGVISVGMVQERQAVIIRISNKADAATSLELERMFDRFYRVDAARTSDTGGSGLGLAIARSIVESHEGSIWAESENGEIHFYVKLKLVS